VYAKEVLAPICNRSPLERAPVQVTSPSGKLRGFVTEDGSVFVVTTSGEMHMRARAAGVPSPIGLLFSPDKWQLVAFDDHILALQMDTHLKIFHSTMICNTGISTKWHIQNYLLCRH
jgi:hypothetical protein